MKNHFDIKKRIVEAGKSSVLTRWQTFCPALTKEEFLENLKWLCEDPGVEVGGQMKMSRELGLTPDGIIRVNRTYYEDGSFCGFYANRKLWNGAYFTVPCPDGRYSVDGTIKSLYRICLSPADRV